QQHGRHQPDDPEGVSPLHRLISSVRGESDCGAPGSRTPGRISAALLLPRGGGPLGDSVAHFGKSSWIWRRSCQSAALSGLTTLANACTCALIGSLPTRNSRPAPPPTGTVQRLSESASQSAVMMGALTRYQPPWKL